MTDVERVGDLIVGYLQSTLTKPEEQELMEWVNRDVANKKTFQELTDPDTLLQSIFQVNAAEKEIWARLEAEVPALKKEKKVRPLFTKTRVAVAATIIIIAGWAAAWLLKDDAFLRKYDGEIENLSALSVGGSVQDGSATVTKVKNDEVIVSNGNGRIIARSSIHAPARSGYNVVFPDGSQVGLKASSKIEYPTTFSDKNEISISGAADFQVTDNRLRSFHLRVDSIDMNATAGSHFSVIAYKDTPVVTSHLFSGEIKITGNQSSIVLLPGQKLQFDTETGALDIIDADNTIVMTLKKGVFTFADASTKSVMELIQSWYNVKVVFDSETVRNSKISGSFTKNDNIFNVIKMLKENGLVVSFDDPTLTLSAREPGTGMN
jgi:transmembrane sensor